MGKDVDAAADTSAYLARVESYIGWNGRPDPEWGISDVIVSKRIILALVAEVEQLRERADAKERGMNAALSERDTYKREAGQLRAERDAFKRSLEATECDYEALRVEKQQLEERLSEPRFAREPSERYGKEESYWLRQKLDASIRHLRDIEDFYRVAGGTPESFNQVRADRARALYEQISADFLNGKITEPTVLQASLAREQRLQEALRAMQTPEQRQRISQGSGLSAFIREALAAGGPETQPG